MSPADASFDKQWAHRNVLAPHSDARGSFTASESGNKRPRLFGDPVTVSGESPRHVMSRVLARARA